MAPSAAPRAGADLRAARERLGWPIEDVSAALRIRLPHLEALEEGRIDLLPGNAYAVGFLRTYARALGLDPDEIARRFKAEASEVNRRTELIFPAPMPQRGVPAGAVILLGVVLAIGAYAGWYRLSGRRPAAGRDRGRRCPSVSPPWPSKPSPPSPSRRRRRRPVVVAAATACRRRTAASAGAGRASRLPSILAEFRGGGGRCTATGASPSPAAAAGCAGARPAADRAAARPRMPGCRCATATAACC